MRSYEAARGLFSFLGFCSWAVIVIGAIAAFAGASAGSGFGRNPSALQALLAALPGAGIALMGFYGLALVQLGRAGVDSAEYGQQSLDVSRKQLEVSQQLLSQGKQMAASYAALKPTPVAAEVPDAADSGASYANKPTDVPSSQSETLAPDKPEQLSASHTAALPEPKIEVPVAKFLGEKFIVAGRKVDHVNGLYRYGSMNFGSLEKAEAYLEQLGVNQNAKLPSA